MKKNDTNLTAHYEVFAAKVFNKVLKLNENRKYFPILGIGNGANLIQCIIANSSKILQDFEGVDGVMEKIEIVGEPKKIKMISLFDGRDFYSIRKKPVTAHFVNKAVNPRSYKKTANLKKYLKITALGNDTNGDRYVAMFEGHKLPIYGFQFHPERIPWDKKEKDHISYTLEAVTISQKFLNYFTKKCRKNRNKIFRKQLASYYNVDIINKLPKSTSIGSYFVTTLAETTPPPLPKMEDHKQKHKTETIDDHKHESKHENKEDHKDHKGQKDTHNNDDKPHHRLSHSLKRKTENSNRVHKLRQTFISVSMKN